MASQSVSYLRKIKYVFNISANGKSSYKWHINRKLLLLKPQTNFSLQNLGHLWVCRFVRIQVCPGLSEA